MGMSHIYISFTLFEGKVDKAQVQRTLRDGNAALSISGPNDCALHPL